MRNAVEPKKVSPLNNFIIPGDKYPFKKLKIRVSNQSSFSATISCASTMKIPVESTNSIPNASIEYLTLFTLKINGKGMQAIYKLIGYRKLVLVTYLLNNG